MPTYKYKCFGCNKDYLEHRQETDPQWFTHCDVCHSEFVLVDPAAPTA
jgi:predicted nucleic acid-binding Zn ribbon protein